MAKGGEKSCVFCVGEAHGITVNWVDPQTTPPAASKGSAAYWQDELRLLHVAVAVAGVDAHPASARACRRRRRGM